jgi:hypothetical protein
MRCKWLVLFILVLLGESVFGQSTRQVSDDYTVPLPFDLEGNGISVVYPLIDYRVEGESKLKLGKWELDTEDFRVGVFDVPSRVKSDETGDHFLVFYWPQAIPWIDEIEILDSKKQLLSKVDVGKNGLMVWKTFLSEGVWSSEVDTDTGKPPPPLAGFQKIGDSSFGVLDFPLRDLNSTISKGISVCFKSKGNHHDLLVCTPELKYSKATGFQSKGKSSALKVLINDQVLGRKALINEFIDLDLAVTMQNSSRVALYLKSPKFEIIEIVRNEKEDIIKGQGIAPLNGSVTREEDSGFMAATINKEEQTWAVESEFGSVKKIEFPTSLGATVRAKIIMDRAPIEKNRSFVKPGALIGTYRDEFNLEAYSSVKLSKLGGGEYITQDGNIWTHKVKTKSKTRPNRSTVKLLDESKANFWVQKMDIIRASSSTVSIRGIGTITQSGFSMQTEIGGEHWFENMMGLDSYYLGRLRWGVEGNYFLTVGKLDTGDSLLGEFDLSILNLALKYRFTPGLSNHHPSWGAMTAYQGVSFGDASANMLGMGVFWARSLPSGFNKMFNLVKWFRYPKWVQAQMLFYPVALSDATLGGNYYFNFQGKMYVGKSSFIRVGGGLRSLQFVDNVNLKSIGLNSLYGSFGYGYLF